MLPNVVVVSGWCNKISVSVSVSVTPLLHTERPLGSSCTGDFKKLSGMPGVIVCMRCNTRSRSFVLGTNKSTKKDWRAARTPNWSQTVKVQEPNGCPVLSVRRTQHSGIQFIFHCSHYSIFSGITPWITPPSKQCALGQHGRCWKKYVTQYAFYAVWLFLHSILNLKVLNSVIQALVAVHCAKFLQFSSFSLFRLATSVSWWALFCPRSTNTHDLHANNSIIELPAHKCASNTVLSAPEALMLLPLTLFKIM